MPFPKSPRTVGISVALAVGLTLGGLLGVWLPRALRPSRQDRLDALRQPAPEMVLDAAAEARIRAFCGDCHALPRPASFHRGIWHDEVEKGYQFYAQSGRTDLLPPPMDQTVAYFRSRAPEQLSYPAPVEADTPYGTTFQIERLRLDSQLATPPAIAGLRWQALDAAGPPQLLTSDMMSGQVCAVDLRDPRRSIRSLAQLRNPCHLEPCDLDKDGRLDLLVADLGSFEAMDHDRGRVVLLRQTDQPGKFEEVVLASGLGRTADARPLDYDGDGKLDVVVAEFGWERTGRILLLHNVTERGQALRFQVQELDPRTGTIHVPVSDLNGDGRPDFVALISNENECLEAFLNQGQGKFQRTTLWRAPDLTYGSTGIELVDLDGDGDLDILYTNGDAFDNMYVSPWHGVQWLENRGHMQYEYHRLTDMPGACVARTGDFDGDGDLDIVVVGILPRQMKPDTLAARQQPSIVLLEQTSPGKFVRHTLETGDPAHAAATVGDFDGDGDLDFAVGNHFGGNCAPGMERVWSTIWWNQRITKP